MDNSWIHDLISNKYTIKKLERRFIKYKRIDLITNCWLWIGYRTKDGYGRLTINKKRILVHRLSMCIWSNFDPNSDKLVLHKLECKNKNCFNPDHLYIGTHQDNSNDMVASGISRHNYCKYGHLVLSNYHDRDRRNSRRRYCATCRMNRVRKWRNKKKQTDKNNELK